jgi:hypothetical protein
MVLGVLALAAAVGAFLWLRGEGPSAGEGPRGDLDVELLTWRCGHESVVTASETIPAEGDFCFVALDIANRGGEPRTLEPSCQFLLDDAGERYRVRADIMELDQAAKAGFGRPIPRGAVVEVTALYFDVPKGTTPVALDIHASCVNPGLRVPLTPELEGAEA